MQLSGTLRNWDEERGFGFIAPTQGGRELFVHISAFPRDGSHPTVGEALLYETDLAKDGRPQAVRVRRKALGDPSTYPRATRGRGERSRSGLMPFIAVGVAIALGVLGYTRLQRSPAPPTDAFTEAEGPATHPANPPSMSIPLPARFTCDGRKHCSQMTSCTEAKFFLANCPGPEMDGDGDRIPCEQQWCTHPAAP